MPCLIERLSTRLVELPLAKPVGTAIHEMRSVGCVLVEVSTTDGLVGQSLIFTLNADRIRSFNEMVLGFEPFVVGKPVHRTEGISSEIWKAINPTGHKGVTVSGLSAIDVAVWDAHARTLEVSLAHLWGSCRDKVDTYASSGLWLSSSIHELVEQAREFVERGFKAIKIRVGKGEIADDVARVAAVRDAVGAGISLLADANQKYAPKHAIQLGRALEPYDLTWLEEPVSAYDLVGSARVRSALDIPIASGETEYTRFGMADMIKAEACDILMPDLQRIGGYTEFRKSAALASAHHLPVSSHFFTEYSLVLAAAIDNVISVEHIDWFTPLFCQSPRLENGKLVVPDRNGHGFTFDPDAVEYFSIS